MCYEIVRQQPVIKRETFLPNRAKLLVFPYEKLPRNPSGNAAEELKKFGATDSIR